MRTNLYLYNRISRIFITPCYIGNKELYSKEQEQVYNRNGWETEEIRKWIDEDRNLEKILTQRKKYMQIQIIDNKIRNAKYNTRYKQIGRKDGRVKYMEKETLEQERIEDEMRERESNYEIKKCGNLEEANRYWQGEEEKRYRFFRIDKLEHYVEECVETSDWFKNLGTEKKERLEKLCNEELEYNKGKIILMLWNEKKKREKEQIQERRRQDKIINRKEDKIEKLRKIKKIRKDHENTKLENIDKS